MPVVEYHLFRVKFVAPSQLSLFPDRVASPRTMFEEAIQAKPSIETTRKYVWHVGNIERFNANSGCFAVGRTTNTTIEKYDQSTRNFVEESFEASPYTHCVYDLHLGLVAIARKGRLASSTSGIASRLAELLSVAPTVRSRHVSVLIDPIYDPESFLRKLASAHVVTRFRASFTGPNPFDADELFQKPLSVYCQSARGTRGSVEIEGDQLDKEVLAEVTRSTAATGNEASAKVQKDLGMPFQRIHLKGDQVSRRYPGDHHDRSQVAEDMRAEYARVRKT